MSDKTKRIVIDTGHGNGDPGATGNGLVEADITGQLGTIVKEKLSGYEAEVLLAPRGSLSERAAFANKVGADFFLSIHVNAGGGTGYESYIYPGASQRTVAIAESFHKALAAFYIEQGFRDRGLKRSNFAVLRDTGMPAVLIENLFIDSTVDAAFLRDNLPVVGNEIAWALAVALGLKAKLAPPAATDLAVEVQKLKDILNQRDIELATVNDKHQKAIDEVQRMKQEMRKMSGICSKYVAM